MGSSDCGYAHDVADFGDIPGETWECPHAATRDGRCLFHLDRDAKTSEEVVAAFRKSVMESTWDQEGSKRFLGATFGDFRLTGDRLVSDDARAIDLRDADVHGQLDWSGLHSELPIRIEGITVHGPAIFDNAYCARELALTEGTFLGPVSFFDATFADDARFTDVDFHRVVTFAEASFDGDARFTDSAFGSHVKFTRSEITGSAHFGRTRFASRARFADTQFQDDVSFEDSLFTGIGWFQDSHFGGVTRFDGARFARTTQFTDTTFDGDATFVEVRCRGTIRFDDAAFDRDVDFSGHLQARLSFDGARVGRRLTLRDLEASDATAISLRRAQVPAGRLTQPLETAVPYDLTGATIGAVTLGNRAGGTASFGRYRFDQTTFDGFEFSNYRSELAASNWTIHTFGEPSERTWSDVLVPSVLTSDRPSDDDAAPSQRAATYAAHEETYLKAKNGANRVGDTHAAAEFFIRELNNRRRKHLWTAVAADGLRETVGGFYRWIANLSLGVTAGYGERPSYVVSFSAFTILLFATLFSIAAPRLYPSFLGYIALSTGTFVTLLFGNPGPIEQLPAVSTVAHVEAITGAFLIALFVFTLTRSIHR